MSNPRATFTTFVIDRWARIYSGFAPALVFVAFADWWTIAHAGGVSHETLERFTFAGFLHNAFLLQVPSWFLPFGSDAALWSVAIEFWIYLFVGSIAFIYRDGLSAFRIALLLLFSIVPLQCVTQNNMVLIPWGMGAAIEITINRGLFRKFSLEKLVAGGAIALCIYAARFVEGDGTYNILSYTVLAVAFAAVVECSLRSNPLAITKLIAWCAGWSYSLYLLHHTILIDVADLRYDRTGFAFAILGSIIFSICFAELTEKHHKKLASWIKSKLSSTSEPPARIDPTNRCYGQLTRR